jgi:iron complex transport system ATP-binding protein
MDSFVELRNVSVLRDSRKILDSINLNINSDENVAIIGPNGSGKSTLIELITGKIYPSYMGDDTFFSLFGRTRWNICDLGSMLGIVTSKLEHDFHTAITGAEMVLSGFFSSIGLFNNHLVTKDMIKKSDEIIELLDISFLKDKKLETMSSGQARRFLIARALVKSPKVLVLDEPSDSLDIASSVKFHNTMRKIVALGTKIVLATHRMSDIIPEINRFIFLKKGKIFADGGRIEVFNSNTFSSLFDMKVSIYENNGVCSIASKG